MVDRRVVDGFRNLILHRPAVPLAILLIAGIFLSQALPTRPVAWLVLAIAFLITAGVNFRSAWRCTICLAIATVLLSLSAAQIDRHQVSPHDIALFVGDQPLLAELELTLIDAPRLIQPSDAHPRPLPPNQVALAEVRSIAGWDGNRPADGRILLRIGEWHPALAAGQTVRAVGLLQAVSPPMNPGENDWQAYYRLQRLNASLSVPHADNITLISSPESSFLMQLRFRVGRALEMGFTSASATDLALLQGLFLGENDSALRALKQSFLRTGTSHHLAISGMHVAILCAFVYFICRLMRLSPRLATWIATAFILTYGLLVIPSASVTRAVLLCMAVGAAMLGRRHLDLVQLLALVAAIMLMIRPLDLYAPAFQLSFGTVLGLILLTPRLLAEGHREMAPTPVSTLHPVLAWMRTWLVRSLLAGIVAWAVAMPLVAFHFERINPWAIVAGVLMAPIVFVAIIASAIKVILTLLLPGFATVWAGFAIAPAAALRHMVEWMARWPLTDLPAPSPPVWLLVLYYMALAMPFIVQWQRPRWTRPVRFLPAIACLAVILLPILPSAAHRQPGELRVTILSVGAGSCAMAELPDGSVMLIDAGSNNLIDLSRRTIEPYLRHRTIRTIDSAWISHADYDHFGAAIDLLDHVPVRRIVVTPHFMAGSTTSSTARRLIDRAASVGTTVDTINPGLPIPLADRTTLEVLWPTDDAPANANESSMVLRLTHAGRSILFTGDVQTVAQSALMEQPHAIRADVLIAPHHGSAEATTARFIQAVDPQWIISSNDRTLSNKQLQFEALVGDRPLYRTHNRGAVTITINADGQVRIETFRQ